MQHEVLLVQRKSLDSLQILDSLIRRTIRQVPAPRDNKFNHIDFDRWVFFLLIFHHLQGPTMGTAR